MAERDSLDPIVGRAPLVNDNPTFHELTEAVARPIEKPSKAWWGFFAFSLSLLGVFFVSVGWLLWQGTGVWGLNNPVGWGWAIVNFVFWVGIGHAGTLISAVLFLFRQQWRTSINRAAEAMTIFAVICALVFPNIHVGRIWVIYWAMPIPNQMDMWPNFRSPLLWDVFAVSTYFTVSLLFWYVGLIPDIATMRDRSKTKIRQIAYGIFALGWRGSHRHWVNYEAAYLLLAAMATPLVLSVHSIVSFDFAVSNLPGWHTTIFPPYFVAGAIFSGFAMVLTLMVPLRQWFGLGHIIHEKHLENMAKIILLTGSLVGYAYAMEFFIAWYSGNPYESFAFVNRAFGEYWWAYAAMVGCNVITPQFFWFKKIRRSPIMLFILSIFVNIGMWFERFVITVTSLHHDFLPSSWGYYTPTIWDMSVFAGTFGLFFTLFCLFARFLPTIALAEVKTVMPAANPHLDHGHGGHGEVAETKAVAPVETAKEAPKSEPEPKADAAPAEPEAGGSDASNAESPKKKDLPETAAYKVVDAVKAKQEELGKDEGADANAEDSASDADAAAPTPKPASAADPARDAAPALENPSDLFKPPADGPDPFAAKPKEGKDDDNG